MHYRRPAPPKPRYPPKPPYPPKPAPTPVPDPIPAPSQPIPVSVAPPAAVFADTLANMQVGGSASGAVNTYVSFRFRAASSSLVSARIYLIGPGYSGYSGGTGGTIRVSVRADAAGLPSGSDLGFVDIQPGEGAGYLVTFGTAVTLAPGTRYHLVFTNVDPSPTVNFSSVDNLFVYGGPIVPRQLRWSDADFGACRKFGTGAWQEEPQYTPILALTYADGTAQGCGYMEVAVADYGTISGAAKVRESFVVSSPCVVSGVVVRVRRSSGTGPLTVRLEDASGTLIDEGTVPASEVPVSAPGGDNGGAVRVAVSFAPHTLTPATYRLVLSAPSATYTTFVIRRGGGYGYPSATYLGGSAEKTADGAVWSALGRVAGQNDLQFALT